jgi:hypothetical protein
MLTWVGIDCHDIKRLRHDVGHVFNDRLRRRQRVRGRGSAARCVQLQCGLLIFIDHINRVCGNHGHLPRVRCLPQLHG